MRLWRCASTLGRMSARHVTMLAALSAIWGGSYLLIKYALDGFSAAAIVSFRSLLASAVLFAILRSRALAGADDRRSARSAVVGADARRDRRRRAVPADHVRRARRAERADRGADLARVAVRRAAGAVHRSPASRSTAARALGMLLGLGGVALVVGVESLELARAVPRRARHARRGVLLRALELRGQGPLRLARRGPDLVDLGHGRRRADAPGGDRHDARATRRRWARRPRSSRSAWSAPRWPSSSSTS